MGKSAKVTRLGYAKHQKDVRRRVIVEKKKKDPVVNKPPAKKKQPLVRS